MPKRIAAAAIFLALAAFLVSQPAPQERPGPLAGGGALLPNGWRVTPVGTEVPLDTFPMSSALSNDGKYLLVLNGGYRPPSISVLRTDTMDETARVPIEDGWLGLTFSPDGKFVYVGGGSRASVFEFTFNDGKLAPSRTFVIAGEKERTHQDFIGDVAVSPDGRLIYAAGLYRDAVYIINPQSGRMTEKLPTGRRPYRILFHPDGKSYFVSSWADGTVYHHKAETGERIGAIRVGQHPTAMVWRARKANENDEMQQAWIGRIFVTAANTNTVYVLGVNENRDVRMIESINIALTPMQPLGMTPSALGLNKEESRLYVVCSDANAVATVDVSEADSAVLGFIPTGWYPTAVQALPDNRIVILNGRGTRSFPNPKGPNPSVRPAPVHLGDAAVEYVARIQTGTASVVNPPTDEELDKYSEMVLRNSPYSDAKLQDAGVPAGNPVPTRPGDKSPIEHVICIVKENRTYDQVLGDLGKGNGDPALTLFDEKSAPNHRKLAREFVLLDNFHVNADVSADGHNWSTSAIASDYVQKMWPNSYAGRRRHYDYEGSEPAAIPPAGYIWTNANQAGISMRNFGWWVNNVPTPAPAGERQIASVRDPVLAKSTNLNYRGFDLDYLDIERAKVFIAELGEWEKAGTMPKLVFLRLGNDHTYGAAAGRLHPLSMMADNDQALGNIVEAVSKSRFWGSTAIFVIEDDAQDGPDHVDSHRALAYVLSPYTRRGVIDSSMYNTTSVLRTMELILGMRPMTHFDAGARPMWAAFSDKPDGRPYQAVTPAMPLDRRNAEGTAAAMRTAKLDFAEADRIDDDEMNDILWRTIRGTEPPAPVRSWFAR